MKRLIFALIAFLFVSGIGFAQDYVSRKKKEKTEQPRPSNRGAKRKQKQSSAAFKTASCSVCWWQAEVQLL